MASTCGNPPAPSSTTASSSPSTQPSTALSSVREGSEEGMRENGDLRCGASSLLGKLG